MEPNTPIQNQRWSPRVYLSGGSGRLTASRGGSDMFRTLSRMICRMVFRNAFRKSEVLHTEHRGFSNLDQEPWSLQEVRSTVKLENRKQISKLVRSLGKESIGKSEVLHGKHLSFSNLEQEEPGVQEVQTVKQKTGSIDFPLVLSLGQKDNKRKQIEKFTRI